MDSSGAEKPLPAPLALGSEWAGGSGWTGTLFWRLVSWSPARLAFVEVVLGRETLAQLIFHYGRCKVQEKWDGAGGRGCNSLGTVHPIRELPHKQTCQRVFMCLEWLPGGILESNKHMTSVLIIFPLAKGCLINKW